MKMFVIVGINNLMNTMGPLGVARTTKGRDQILLDTTWCSNVQKVFEIEVEEDKVKMNEAGVGA